MAHIESFVVVEPPTSQDVIQRWYESIDPSNGGDLELVVLGEHDVPAPTRESVAIRVAQTIHKNGGLIISGKTVQEEPVIVRTDEDLGRPARVRIVRK